VAALMAAIEQVTAELSLHTWDLGAVHHWQVDAETRPCWPAIQHVQQLTFEASSAPFLNFSHFTFHFEFRGIVVADWTFRWMAVVCLQDFAGGHGAALVAG
jgi:hypothetical protein